MKKTSEPDLLELLEAVYLGTLAPIGQLLREAGVDLLKLDRQPDVATYWEPHAPYDPMDREH